MEPSQSSRAALYRAAVEAILFASAEARTAAELAAALGRVTGVAVEADDVERAVLDLRADYARRQAGLAIEAWGGGYRMATHADLAAFVQAAHVEEKAVRLSGALLETLAVVAYKQPVTKPEVDFVRGVDSGYALGRLAEMGLVEIAGRSDGVGKPLLYGTTSLFLDTFGLDSLAALPTLREVEELLDTPAFSREKMRLLLLRDVQDGAPPANPSDDEATAPTA